MTQVVASRVSDFSWAEVPSSAQPIWKQWLLSLFIYFFCLLVLLFGCPVNSNVHAPEVCVWLQSVQKWQIWHRICVQLGTAKTRSCNGGHHAVVVHKMCVSLSVCAGVYDEIGWIRSHFYFLAQHWWRLSRASSAGVSLGVCQVTRHNSNPIFTVSIDWLHHIQYWVILEEGRGEEQRGKRRRYSGASSLWNKHKR